MHAELQRELSRQSSFEAPAASANASARAAEQAVGGTGGAGVAQVAGGSEAAAAVAAATARATQAAQAVLEREDQIQRLTSERTALRLQLENETGRRTTLEKQIDVLQSTGGGAAGSSVRIDLPLLAQPRGSGNGRRDVSGPPPKPRSFSRLLQAHVPRPKPQLVQAVAVVDDCVEAIDHAVFTATRFLRIHRPLRLGCVGYLALLHIWIAVLLMHMAPALPSEPHPHARYVLAGAPAVSNRSLMHRNRMDRF